MARLVGFPIVDRDHQASTEVPMPQAIHENFSEALVVRRRDSGGELSAGIA